MPLLAPVTTATGVGLDAAWVEEDTRSFCATAWPDPRAGAAPRVGYIMDLITRNKMMMTRMPMIVPMIPLFMAGP